MMILHNSNTKNMIVKATIMVIWVKNYVSFIVIKSVIRNIILMFCGWGIKVTFTVVC